MLLADGTDFTNWFSVATNLGGMGFAGWMCYYLVTKWIPDLVDRFERHLDKARADFREESKLQREHDSAQDSLERENCDRRFTELKDSHEGLKQRVDSTYNLVKEIRHGVNDVLHGRATERAAQEALRKAGVQTTNDRPSNEETGSMPRPAPSQSDRS